MEDEAAQGLINPAMDNLDEDEVQALSGGSSSEIMEELRDARTLKQDLTKKRRQKQKELSEKLISPKDDLTKELRTAKKRSKKRLDETVELAKEADAEKEASQHVGHLTLDGTVPMSDDEEAKDTIEGGPPDTVSLSDSGTSRLLKFKRRMSHRRDTVEDAVEQGHEPSLTADEGTVEHKHSSRLSKMRSRLQKAKEQGESEALEEDRQVQRERRLKDMKDRSSLTRFDTEGFDPLETERNNEEKAKKLRLRWRRMEENVADKGEYIPTPEEAYDFFTRIYETELEDETEPGKVESKEKVKKKDVQEEGEVQEEEEEEPKAGPSQEDHPPEEEATQGQHDDHPEDERPLLDDYGDEGYGLIAVRKAEYISLSERKKKEEELLYIPSVISIPASEKVFEQMEPRFLEEEGFYIGEKPSVKITNMNRLEHRLLKEGSTGRRWFGEDGRVVTLPDPLKESPSRPPVPEEPEPYLETVFYEAIMKEFDSRFIDGAMDGSGQYQLDIDINSISFTHHHLFSREHVLAAKLTHLFEQYVVRRRKNMVGFLTEKLKALKTSARHLQEHLMSHKREMGSVDRQNYDTRLQDYAHEVTKTRHLRDSEEEADRHLLKNIISVWKEIKKLRFDQNFTNTAVKLQIRKENTDKAEDEVVWKKEIEEELEEVREAHEKEFQKKTVEYNHLLDAYNLQQKNKKAATKRRRKRERQESKTQVEGSQESVQAAGDEPSEEEIQKDEEILEEPDLPEPQEPVREQEKDLRDRIVAKAMEIRRRPGEPKLFPDLSNTATITPTSQCPRGEQRRRDEVSKCKLFIKILFNNKEVSRTSSKPLSQEFRVNYGQIYNLKIVKWPESVKLQIYEHIGFSTTLLTEIYAGIPEASVTSDIVQLEELEFSSDVRVNHSHEGVGSGVSFSFDVNNVDLVCLMTTGVLASSVGWGVEADGTPLVPPSSHTTNNIYSAMKRLDPVAAIGASAMVDVDKLSKWFSESRLDPNDPSNSDLVYLFRPRGENYSTLAPPEYFRLEQLQEEFNFVDDDEIENNKRFRLIEYRDTEIQEFRNYKMIPINEREVPRDTFTDYEKKKREEDRIRKLEDIESHRAAISRYMQRIREQVMRRFRLAAHQKRLEEVVLEEAVPNVAMIGISLIKFAQPRHPLRPERRERKKVTAQAIKGDEVKILVNITRAFDIPIRAPQQHRGGTARGATEKSTSNLAGETQVKPYVEALFQRHTTRTSVADGPNPSFNEELELPFKAPNEDFSTANLQGIHDNIYINLFDEVAVDILEDDRQRGNTVHQRLEKKWLGSLKIPFSTIYLNGKIDGTFRVHAPPVLLGYTLKGQGSDPDVDIGMGEKSHTFLSMFITIEPPLLPAEPTKERFSSNEDEKLLQYTEKWQTEFETAFPKREVKTTVIDVSGKTVFITRFIKAIRPPDELLNTGSSPEDTAELVARYVSLIPCVSDTIVFPGLCDIWSTCDQFMQMLAGDEEEHSVLLTNFFLSMGKTAWLVLGHGIPEGPTAYVMTVEDRDFWIWNASTGEHFSSRDSFCPLQSLGCVINNENIWANIQQYEEPSRITFDFSNTKNWKPFFSRSYPSPCLSSVQPEHLVYLTADKNYVRDLQEKIEHSLKNKIMEWRSRHITRWNRYCTQSIRNLLPKLEESRGKSIGDQHLSELENFLGNYRMSGFPINMPFTEINPIIESVFATGVHTQESSDVEYALAVYVHPYPNSVLSVWVYVASLVRIR